MYTMQRGHSGFHSHPIVLVEVASKAAAESMQL